MSLPGFPTREEMGAQVAITPPWQSGPGKGHFTLRGPGPCSWGVQALTSRPALETWPSWVSRSLGSLSANSGRLQPDTLSHWLAGVSGQIGISLRKGAS